MWSERSQSRPERSRFVHLALALFVLATMSVAAAMERPARAVSTQEPNVPALSNPIGDPGRPFGDGFMIRHGFATENTWYLPGYLHAGEDWYRVDGETAGATVYAMGDGEVVFAGSNYPGRVVVIQHQEDLYSMYGHLDPDLAVDRGDLVERGERIGAVGTRDDGVPNHLHFEVRTFLTTSDVNGDAPRYGFACGVECPPGPGYWPIEAPDNPVDVGWRNPSHAIAGATDGVQGLEAVVAAEPTVSELRLHAQPSEGAEVLATARSKPGQRFPLVDVRAAQVDSDGTSAEAYSVWYRIQLDQDVSGWVRAIVPSTRDTGSDGRASSLRFVLLPAVADAARQVGREGLANTTI